MVTVRQWRCVLANPARLLLFILSVLLFQLNGCARDGNRQAYIGWQCSGQQNSDNWRCEQREFRNGAATRAVVDNTDQSSGDAAANHAEHTNATPNIETRAATVVIFENGVRQKNWREQLPGLSAVEAAVPAKQATGAPARRDNRVTPEPEPAFASWADQAGDKSHGDPVNDSAVAEGAGQADSAEAISMAAAAPALSRPDSASAPPAANRSRRGYTVQLGAFGNAAQLVEFVEQRNLAGLDYWQGVATAASGRTLRVLLWGQFDTAAEATAAWQQVTRNYPAVDDYWVRSLAAIVEPSP